MRLPLPLMTILATAALIGEPVQAQEAFKLYDNFGAAPLDPARWSNSERVLAIRGGALNIMQRTWGLGNVDGAVSFSNWNQAFPNPGAITAMRARINVTALEVGACPASTVIGQSRARIVGGFFNVGTPTPAWRCIRFSAPPLMARTRSLSTQRAGSSGALVKLS